MIRYYRELHDRELLSQAEALLTELHRRRLFDVRVPCGRDPNADLARCPVHTITRSGTVLSVVIDSSFEPIAHLFPHSKAESAQRGSE